MGYFYDVLIPPAILWKDPGLAKEEFVAKLEKTYSSDGEIGRDLPIGAYEPSVLDNYHKGLYGLANVLGLKFRPGSQRLEKEFFRQFYNNRGMTLGSIEDQRVLISKFPVEEIYDFSQPAGVFRISLSDDRFLWKQEKGKFYLDPKTFDRIPAGFVKNYDCIYGYTDLVITAEAVKHKAWKLFSRNGRSHLRQFFEEFPDSRTEYEKAVWDAHTSLAAKEKGMSCTEFLRMRLTGVIRKEKEV